MDTENKRIERERNIAIKRGDNRSVYSASHARTIQRNEFFNLMADACSMNPIHDPQLNINNYYLHLQNQT